MADLQIGDELSAALNEIAANENLSVEALLNNLLERYRIDKHQPLETTEQNGWRKEALDNFIGMFDDDVHDLSTSVQKSMTDAIRKKHAGSD